MAIWIIDFEAYQVHGDFYPLEITLLNAQDVQECFHFYIYYPRDHYNNLTIKFQFRQHGIKWGDGDDTMASALEKLHRQVWNGDTIYVKGGQKTELVNLWFPKNTVIDLMELRKYLSMKSCREHTCDFHKKDVALNCSRRKAFTLLPYVLQRINISGEVD